MRKASALHCYHIITIPTLQDRSQEAEMNSLSVGYVRFVGPYEDFNFPNDDTVHLPTGPLAEVRQRCPELWVTHVVLQRHGNRRSEKSDTNSKVYAHTLHSKALILQQLL